MSNYIDTSISKILNQSAGTVNMTEKKRLTQISFFISPSLAIELQHLVHFHDQPLQSLNFFNIKYWKAHEHVHREGTHIWKIVVFSVRTGAHRARKLGSLGSWPDLLDVHSIEAFGGSVVFSYLCLPSSLGRWGIRWARRSTHLESAPKDWISRGNARLHSNSWKMIYFCALFYRLRFLNLGREDK